MSLSVLSMAQLAAVLSLAQLATARLGGPKAAETCPVTATGQSFGNLESPQIDECSGLAASKVNTGLYWVNNDSGAGPHLHAIDRNGRNLGRLQVNGADAVDWEDIAIGPGPIDGTSYVYIADTGNNWRNRETVQIYRFPEPFVDTNQDIHVSAERFDVRYPGGDRHDCEAMFVDPVTKMVYIITKGDTAGIYRVSVDWAVPLTFEKVGEISVTLVTAADISPKGDLIAVRSYGDILLWPRSQGVSVEESFSRQIGCAANSREERQGEAFAFGALGDHYLTVSEGEKEPVWYFELSNDFYASLLGTPEASNSTFYPEASNRTFYP